MSKMKKKRQWVRTFEVSEAEKHPKGHMMYTVTSVLFPAGFPEASTKLVTKKRFSEFQKLHKILSQIHKNLYLSGQVPDFPKTNFFSRFDPAVLEDRRCKCLELLEFAAQHPPLYNSQVFLNFFATVTSPTNLATSEECIGQLMEQGQIMEAAMATTNLARDPSPVMEPEESSVIAIEDKATEVNEEDAHDNEEMPRYLNEAANVIRKAIECEADERFDESVACYRKAIGTLLESLPRDKCLKRQASVKRRISQYITKAEQLTKLTNKSESGFPHLELFGDVKDLKRYQVEKVLGDKVLLASDLKQDGVSVVIKTLLKSATFSSTSNCSRRKSYLPINIKFMTRLKRYYETDEALILVVDHVAPGRLFDVVHPYLVEKASRLFPKMSCNQRFAVVTPDPEFDRSRSGSVEVDESHRQSDSDGQEDDLEIVCSLKIEDEDDFDEDDVETELLCLNKDGIEKIQCFDQDKREKERFDMLEDHTKEIIQKRLLDDDAEYVTFKTNSDSNIFQSVQTSNLLDVKMSFRKGSLNPLSPLMPLQSALSSAPLSAATTSTVSPTSRPISPAMPDEEHFQLSYIMPTFGGHDLKKSKILPISLLKSWTVQLVKVVLELHSKGIFVQDLNPSNVLLSEDGQLTLSYQCQWNMVESHLDVRALDQLYCAPEVPTLASPSPGADWWSVGVILFELYTGWPLCVIFPSGLRPHFGLPLDSFQAASNEEGEAELKDLISQFLNPIPEMRLVAPNDIKQHKLFRGVDWKN